MLRAETGLRWLVVALVVVFGGMVAAVPAAAAPEAPDDSQYSEEERAEAEKEAAKETAGRTCKAIADKIPGAGDRAVEACSSALEPTLTMDWIQTASDAALCAVISAPLGIARGAGAAACLGLLTVAELNGADLGFIDQLRQVFYEAYEKALETVGKIAEAVEFISDPSSAFERQLNEWKEESTEFFTEALAEVLKQGTFKGDERWWRDVYAVGGGIGLVVLAIMVILTFRQANAGKLAPEEAAESLVPWTIYAGIGIFFGPVLFYFIGTIADGLLGGAMQFLGTSHRSALSDLSDLLALMTAAALPGGSIVGLIIIILLVIAGLSLTVIFALQTAVPYLLGGLAGITFGMMGNPRWRKRALVVPTVVVSLILAQPALVLTVAVVMKFILANLPTVSNAVWEDEPWRMLWGLVLALVGICLLCFAPAALLRMVPMLPAQSSAAGVGSSVGGGMGLGAAAGAVTMAVGMQRASANAANGGVPARSRPSAPTAAPEKTSMSAQGGQDQPRSGKGHATKPQSLGRGPEELKGRDSQGSQSGPSSAADAARSRAHQDQVRGDGPGGDVPSRTDQPVPAGRGAGGRSPVDVPRTAAAARVGAGATGLLAAQFGLEAASKAADKGRDLGQSVVPDIRVED